MDNEWDMLELMTRLGFRIEMIDFSINWALKNHALFLQESLRFVKFYILKLLQIII